MIQRLSELHDLDEVGLWLMRAALWDPADATPGSIRTTSVLLDFPVPIEQVTVHFEVPAGSVSLRMHFDLVNAEHWSFGDTPPNPQERETSA